MSDRAAGLLQEIAKIMENVRTNCRRAVFGRRLVACKFQKWFLGAARKLRDILAPLLPSGPNAVERWLDEPFEVKWPPPLSRCGCKSNVSVGHETAATQSWCPNEGFPQCRRHIVLVSRGVTQLACRLRTLGDSSRYWMISATHSSDETRSPFEKRQAVATTARRLVRGSAQAPESCDFWPGAKACARTQVVCPRTRPSNSR